MDPSIEHPNSYTNLFPNPNSNGCPSINPSLLISTCSYGGLNIVKGVCVSILSIYNPIAYRPFVFIVVIVVVVVVNVVINAENVVDFQWCPSNLHICPHPFVDTPQPLEALYISCSLLTFYLCSFICLSCGYDICGTSTFCLHACTNVGTADGAIFPLIIF